MIADFNNNGQMDFIAVADPDPNSNTNAKELVVLARPMSLISGIWGNGPQTPGDGRRLQQR